MAPRILVVEDDVRSVKLLELILRAKGYETVFARNGQVALSTATSQRFDVILLDLMLPEVDGFDVLREFRADPALVDVPVIITSARARPTAKDEASELGADLYLTKPYRKAELLEAIESLSDRFSGAADRD